MIGLAVFILSTADLTYLYNCVDMQCQPITEVRVDKWTKWFRVLRSTAHKGDNSVVCESRLNSHPGIEVLVN